MVAVEPGELFQDKLKHWNGPVDDARYCTGSAVLVVLLMESV